MAQDEEHLRLLSLFHYVVAGLAGLFSLFPLIHLTIGLIFILAPETFQSEDGQAPPPFFGWFFVAFASVFIIAGLTFAVFVLINGRFLARRRHWLFCVVMSGIECLFMPFGTVLGVFTILVLMRDSTQQLFAAAEQGQSPAAIG